MSQASPDQCCPTRWLCSPLPSLHPPPIPLTQRCPHPLQMMPKYLPADSLRAGEETATLTFTAGGAGKALRKLVSAGDAPFVLQAQCGKPASVLFELVVRPSQLLGEPRALSTAIAWMSNPSLGESIQEAAPAPEAAEDDEPATVSSDDFDRSLNRIPLVDARTVEQGSVEPIQEVLWSVVGLELLQLLLDVVRVAATIALVLAPWRFAALLQVSLESTKRWPLRQVDDDDAFLEDESAHANASTAQQQSQLCTAARGDERDFPPPREEEHKWRGPPQPTCRLHIGIGKDDAWKPKKDEGIPDGTPIYAGGRVLKHLGKLDSALATLWRERLELHRLRRLCVVLEAELLRGVLSPSHWADLALLASRKYGHAFSELRDDALSMPPEQLLRAIEALLLAVECEGERVHAQISEARAIRREALRKRTVSFGALCSRSSSKARMRIRRRPTPTST